jgi:hypothetical protein
MATERQASYLRDRGIDPRCELGDLPKEQASEWIEELKGYAARAGLGGGVPLRAEHLAKLGARDDALAQPPARSMAPVGSNGSKGPSNSSNGDAKLPPLGDESWLKVELSAGVTPLGGDGTVVTVSASTHLRHGPSAEDAEALGALVQRFLEREVARCQRAYVESFEEE